MEEEGPPQLARASMTVCMTPRAKASPQVLEQRREAHEKGVTLTHWPHTYAAHTLTDTGGEKIPGKEYVPMELTAAMRRLL